MKKWHSYVCTYTRVTIARVYRSHMFLFYLITLIKILCVHIWNNHRQETMYKLIEQRDDVPIHRGNITKKLLLDTLWWKEEETALHHVKKNIVSFQRRVDLCIHSRDYKTFLSTMRNTKKKYFEILKDWRLIVYWNHLSQWCTFCVIQYRGSVRLQTKGFRFSCVSGNEKFLLSWQNEWTFYRRPSSSNVWM